MIADLIRLVSTIATILVVIGFALFVVDELRYGSEERQAELGTIAEPSPPPATEREREARHGGVRELIEDTNDVLLDPFAGITSGSASRWVQRGIPSLLAFIVYGLLLRMLANAIPQRRSKAGPGWQEPR